MKVSFSTLACSAWSLDSVIDAATRYGFDGIELRFIEKDDRLWQRPEFRGSGLNVTRRKLRDAGLEVPCVDTSCFFHYPEPGLRAQAQAAGKAMIELAAELQAPGIRVFGDRVQPGGDRDATTTGIADNLRLLADFGRPLGVAVWLESHGDYAPAARTIDILQRTGRPNVGVVWDPLNAYSEFNEDPRSGFTALGKKICHVHVKDARPRGDGSIEPVLMGKGTFPALNLIRLLTGSKYDRFVSFEWEKHWHPEIQEPEVALPHFICWIRSALAEKR
jgi:sugar phosphate isomerase/epimerase